MKHTRRTGRCETDLRYQRQRPNSVDFCKAIAGKIADALIAKALKGDVRACAEIADRTEGKAPQSMHIGVDAELRVIIETIG